MDWAKAIDRNREVLRGIVATLFAMLGLEDGTAVQWIPRHLHRAVLRLLGPAESAVRRLIVIAARHLVVTLKPARPRPLGAIRRKSDHRRLSFPLFDPRKRFAAPRRASVQSAEPRIHFFESDPPVAALGPAPKPEAEAPPAPPDGQVAARRLCLRLQALKRALEDVPGLAKRLARLRARRDQLPSLKFVSPLRPGPPPGHRRMAVHEVDYVLRECHWLAFDALKPDTS